MQCSPVQCSAGHRFEVHRLHMTVAVEYQCDSNIVRVIVTVTMTVW